MIFELRRKGAPCHRPYALPMWDVPHQMFAIGVAEGRGALAVPNRNHIYLQQQPPERELPVLLIIPPPKKSERAPIKQSRVGRAKKRVAPQNPFSALKNGCGFARAKKGPQHAPRY